MIVIGVAVSIRREEEGFDFESADGRHVDVAPCGAGSGERVQFFDVESIFVRRSGPEVEAIVAGPAESLVVGLESFDGEGSAAAYGYELRGA